VSDRTAKRCQAELEEGRENLPCTAAQTPAPRVRIKFTVSVPIAIRRYRMPILKPTRKLSRSEIGSAGPEWPSCQRFSANGLIESRQRFHRNYDVVDGCGVAYANARQQDKTGCGFAWLPHPRRITMMAPEP
jgi:hypothetical protein